MLCFCVLLREYYFSDDNLARDFFLRRKMTADGWIPIVLIATFNRVKNLTLSLPVIVDVSRTGWCLLISEGVGWLGFKDWEIMTAGSPYCWSVVFFLMCMWLFNHSTDCYFATLDMVHAGCISVGDNTGLGHEHQDGYSPCGGMHVYAGLALYIYNLLQRRLPVGLVVEASASRADNPRFESRLQRAFSGSSHKVC